MLRELKIASAILFLANAASVIASPSTLPRTIHGRQSCTVTANGRQQDDVPNILQAFEECGDGGHIIFPENQTYLIASRLNPVVNDVTIEWRGVWEFSKDLSYWRNSSYPIFFQNHAAGFVLTGDGISIDGYDTGGIFGNGDTWYTAEAGDTQPGRPMPFVLWNVSEVAVSNFFVKQPQLWAINIMNGTNMSFDNMYVNATATQAPWGTNWVQNTDGFDTMDARNVSLTNFVYQGGDDCVAIKPRSYEISMKNITCHGGNGIAIGSLGQYLEDSSVEDVVIDQVDIITYNEDMEYGAYVKTWIGELAPQDSYESAGKPRGGGWGNVTNILFSNFNIQGASRAAGISQDSGNNGSYAGTSNMLVSDVSFVNFTGYITGTTSASVSCSERNPCYDIDFENFDIVDSDNSTDVLTCKWVAEGGVQGLSCP